MSLSIINDAYDAAYCLQQADADSMPERYFRQQVANILLALAQCLANRPASVTALNKASAGTTYTGTETSINTGVPSAPTNGPATVAFTQPR